MMGDRFPVSIYVQQKESMHLHEASQRKLMRHLRALDGAAGSRRSLRGLLRRSSSKRAGTEHLEGLRNRGLIQILEDRETGDFVVTAGKGTERQEGVLNLPQRLWSVACKKEEVKATVDELLEQKILAD